jgi:2-oxoglutarate/2-oxoacid ferredoxin oxidoreductase subunit beta
MSNLSNLLSKADNYLKFESKNKHTWCSGCGNYGIIAAMKRALTMENLTPKDVMMCYDVGCNGNESDKFYANTIAQAGDGSTLSEGINHLVHAIRCNYNFTFVLHNNSIYGLTIGQASSTTREHQKIPGTPGETVIPTLNILDFVLSLKPSFVARSFSSNVDHLAETIQAGLNHNGFSFIEVMQACPTFNKATPQEWYWDKLNDVSKLENYDKTDIWQARKIVQDQDQKLAVGIIYQKPRPTFEELQTSRQGYTTTLAQEVKNYDVQGFLKQFQL